MKQKIIMCLFACTICFTGCDSRTDNRYISILPYINHDYQKSMENLCWKKDLSETYALRKKMQKRRYNFVYGSKIKSIRKEIVGKEIPFTMDSNLSYTIDGAVKIVDVTYSGIPILEYTIVGKSGHLPKEIYVYIPFKESALDALDPIYLDLAHQNEATLTVQQPLQINYNYVGWAKFFKGIAFTTKRDFEKFEKIAIKHEGNTLWEYAD